MMSRGRTAWLRLLSVSVEAVVPGWMFAIEKFQRSISIGVKPRDVVLQAVSPKLEASGRRMLAVERFTIRTHASELNHCAISQCASDLILRSLNLLPYKIPTLTAIDKANNLSTFVSLENFANTWLTGHEQ